MNAAQIEVPPAGHIALGEAYDQAYATLEKVKVIEKELAPEAWTEIEKSIFSPDDLDLPVHRLERVTISQRSAGIAVVRRSRELTTAEGKMTVLRGPRQDGVKKEAHARSRVERLMRENLANGELKALAYRTSSREFGEIPDKMSWLKRSAFPGLESIIDSDVSPGPMASGSLIFLERAAFKKWLAVQVVRLTDPRIRAGRRGRPSTTGHIIAEHRRRRWEGIAKHSKPEEAKQLQAWFEGEFALAKAPALKTIRDALGRERI